MTISILDIVVAIAVTKPNIQPWGQHFVILYYQTADFFPRGPFFLEPNNILILNRPPYPLISTKHDKMQACIQSIQSTYLGAFSFGFIPFHPGYCCCHSL